MCFILNFYKNFRDSSVVSLLIKSPVLESLFFSCLPSYFSVPLPFILFY